MAIKPYPLRPSSGGFLIPAIWRVNIYGRPDR